MENEYLAIVRTIQSKYLICPKSFEPKYPKETLEDFDLGGVDCPVCNNTGHIVEGDALNMVSRECECMKKRRSMRSIRNSGMVDMLERYTMDSYQTTNKEQALVKETAQRYLESPSGWFFVFGRSGSGKTHICAAICSGLIEQGHEVKFMPWRDEILALKACQMDQEVFEKRMKKLQTVPVLYIDDFFKGSVSDADINLAFQILNTRYNDRKLRTIISSEHTMNEILGLDEAVGGRIYERARGFGVPAPKGNWRTGQ